MKKTINIHLGGMPFIIDEDAYNILHLYIESLKTKFVNENERAEIIADIEFRIAEVFSKRLDKRQVIDESDVNYVISQLGKPEDIAGNSENEQTNSQKQQETTFNNTTFTQRGEKKLFRDSDNKILGGVISGLCQYFGFNEPIWARLAFVLLLFVVFGTPIFIYFVLWLIVPEAVTATDKLQMRGEAVTLDTIEKEVRDTMNRATDELKKNKIGEKASSIGGTIVKVILVLLSIKVLIIGSIMMFAFLTIMGVSFSIADIPQFAPFTSLLFNENWVYYLVLGGLFFAIGIPIFCLLYFPLKFLVSRNFNGTKKLFKWLTPMWVVSLLTLFVIVISVVKNFTATEKQTEELVIQQPTSDTLSVASLSNENVTVTGFGQTENGFIFGSSDVELKPSKDNLFHIEKVLSSQGKTKEDARKNIKLINYRYSQSGSEISLNPDVEVFKKAKYRKQEVKSIIYIPEGKKVKFTDNGLQMESIYEYNYYLNDMAERVFVVKDGKVVCENCSSSDEEADDNNDDETQVSINGNGINIHATDSTNKVHVSISGNGIKVNSKEKNEK